MKEIENMYNFTFSLLPVALILIGLNVNAQSFNGYALYNEKSSSTVYLIDKDANIAHTWSCNTNGNYAVLLKEDGNIVRGGVNPGNQLNGAASGGVLQEYDPNGNLVWEFLYSTSQYVQHHDIEIMPNGNVLFIAWEVKTSAELIQAGRQSNQVRWPTHIVEIKPSGSTATVVWEWHIWDHMIQDFDVSKDNFGVVADHPELMDINAVSGGAGPNSGDWFHVNGINYNAELDQIVFTARFASEFYIIDHSTTTAEAAGHTGGNSGMGGDFIYRWGNPSNYGAPGTQTIPKAVHDPRWVKDDGRQNGGYIQFFNNEGKDWNGFSGNSAVDAIDAPVDGYNYTLVPGQSYGPSTYTWRHACIDNANGQSASEKLSNGNTFVNLSSEYMYEVDSNDNVVWQYSEGPAKAFRYECTYPGIQILMGVDCNCDAGGTAYVDSCGDCVGGNTGLTPCVVTFEVTASATAATTGMCDGTATAAVTGGVSPYTYSWSTSPVQTSATAVGLCGNTNYTVLVTDANGDTTSTNIFITETGSTGVEQTMADGLVIFPNPSTGIFELGGLGKAGNYRVKVSDMYGHEVLSLSNEKNIDLSGEAVGVYFIRVEFDNARSFTKMISLIK
ncbi:MAG TPA: T9SS type A sorting domain-containing protein [Flavobacteriales bacterium]|nr:T9SS type A sorting domain-containing protein [Flavobacteriales bacterium]HIO73447.1 T9SS type A sorting domain-containing protein [Flavobacteriales bacterium]